MVNKLVFNPITGNFDYVSDLSNYQTLANNPTAGDLASVDSKGQVIDSGYKVNDTGTSNTDILSASEVISRISNLPVGVGSGIALYLSATPSGISSYDLMSKTPDSAAQVIENAVCTGGGSGVYGNPVLIDAYIASQAIGSTTLNAGGWTFNLYGSVSSNTGDSAFQIDVYTYSATAVETLLFSATSGVINGSSPILVAAEVVEQAFVVNATDKLLFKIYGKTTGSGSRTISLYNSGTTHYSNVVTPIVESHNDLIGIQGGSSLERYHLSLSQYTNATQNASSSLTGLLSPTDWNTFNNKPSLTTIDNAISAYEALYVDPYHGLDTNSGTLLEPFQTVQVAINSFTAGSPHVIYVLGSTTNPITFRSGDVSMRLVFDPKTSHTGTITLVSGNTSIYFDSLDASARISGTINDASSGAIYWGMDMTNAVYNKTGGSGSSSPTGYVEFSGLSLLDNFSLTLSGNTTVRTLGTGSMAKPTITNGILVLQHKGSVVCPAMSGGTNPLLGVPVLLVQSTGLQLIALSSKALTCSATYGSVYLYSGSTLQADGSTLSPVDFTGAGATLPLVIGSGMQLASSGNTFPALVSYSTSALYLKSDYTPTNYIATSAASIAAHLGAIDTALGVLSSNALTSKPTQNSNFTALKNARYPVNTASNAVTVTLPSSPVAGNTVQLLDYAGTFASNNLIINPNGSKINGLSSNYVINIANENVTLVYIDSTQGWLFSSGIVQASSSNLTVQSPKTSNFTAVSNNIYPVNTTSSSITATLPASASSGNQIVLSDYAGTFASNNLTINPNGLLINGLSSNLILSLNRVSIVLTYIDNTQGWIVTSAANQSSGGGGTTSTITYQSSSSTFPSSPAVGDHLIVTSNGLYTGVLKEDWIYSLSGWYQLAGSTPVSGSIIDNTITDSSLLTVVGRYIVPASGLLNLFIGNANKYCDFDGINYSFSTPVNNSKVVINSGVNASQTWQYSSGAWTQIVSSASTVYNWALASTYSASNIVIYKNTLYVANSNIPANTPFVEGSTGATYKLLGAYNAPQFNPQNLLFGAF